MKDKINKIIDFIWQNKTYIIIMTVYTVISLILLVCHEPWRDEAQAWLIGKNLSPIGMFKQMYYEGHPCLWSLILSPFAKLGFPYITLNLISFAIMWITALLILKKAPFNEITKTLLVLSAPFIYNYSVISRNYCLIALALCLIAINYKQRHDKPIKYTLLVLFLAWTHVVMLGMAGGLYFLFFWEEFITRRKTNTKEEKKKALISLLIATIGLLLMVIPIGLGSVKSNLVITETRKEPLYIITYIAFFLFNEATTFQISILLFLLVAFIIYEFLYNKKGLIIFIFTMAFHIYTYYFVYYLSNQRCDIYLFVLMFLMWIQDKDLKSTFQKYFHNIVSVTLVLLLALYSYRYKDEIIYDVKSPYTQSKLTGNFIQNNIEKDSVMIAPNMFVVTSVMPYIKDDKNIRFYGLEIDDYYTYVSWDYTLNRFDSEYLKNKINTKFSNVKNLYMICDGIECWNYLDLANEGYLTKVHNSGTEGTEVFSIYKVNKDN